MLISRLTTALRRRSGHTTAAASSGATVLCKDEHEANRVRREHGCPARSIQSPEKLVGSTGPYVLDVSTLYTLEQDAFKWLADAKNHGEAMLNDAIASHARERRSLCDLRDALRARVAELQSRLSAAQLESASVNGDMARLLEWLQKHHADVYAAASRRS